MVSSFILKPFTFLTKGKHYENDFGLGQQSIFLIY